MTTARATWRNAAGLRAAALAYSTFRLAEAWGLWRARRWAEWLGVITGLIYVPFEVVSFLRHPRAVPLVALVVNVFIVLVLVRRIRLAGHATSSDG